MHFLFPNKLKFDLWTQVDCWKVMHNWQNELYVQLSHSGIVDMAQRSSPLIEI